MVVVCVSVCVCLLIWLCDVCLLLWCAAVVFFCEVLYLWVRGLMCSCVLCVDYCVMLYGVFWLCVVFACYCV